MPPQPNLLRVLARLLPAVDREQIVADLSELYAERRRGQSRVRADLWLLAQTIRFIWVCRTEHRSTEPRSRLADLRLDVRDAWRQVRRAPGAPAVMATVLACGIGAAVGVYTIVDAALFAPLPYPNDQSLVLVGEQAGERSVSVSYPNFMDWRERARSFEAIAAYQSDRGTLLTRDGAVALNSDRVSADFFKVLGVGAASGRVLGPADAAADAPAVAVLSHTCWTTTFNGDTSIVGTTVTFDGMPYAVVGVMPPRFDFGNSPDLWVPIDRFIPGSDLANRGARAGTAVVARLATGVTIENATREMQGIAAQLSAEFPGPNATIRATVIGLRDSETGSARTGLLGLLGAVGALLLVGCLNAASVQGARLAARTREFAVRAAVGASRHRLARQVLFEMLIVATAAGLGGLAIAYLLVTITVALDPGGVPRLAEAAVDLRTLPLALGLSAIVGVTTGLLPLAVSGMGPLSQVLHAGGRSATTSRRWTRVRTGLVIVQIATSLALVSGSALMMQTIVRLGDVEPGFDPEGLLAVTMQLTTTGTREEGWQQTIGFYRDLTDRVSAIPGVTSAAFMTPMPLTGANRQNRYWIPGMTATTVAELPRIETAVVSERYFETMRIPMLAGRSFDTTDTGVRSVAIVDTTFVDRYLGDQDPIGKEVVMGLPTTDAIRLRIVGVVGAVHQYRLTQPPLPQIYLAQQQLPLGGWLLVRAAGDPSALTPAVRAAVQEVNRTVPILRTYPATDLLRDSTATETFSAFVLTLFAALALGLAGLGLSGLMAHDVAARRREIGVRLALGATAGGVQRQVVARAMTLVAVGSGLGIGASWLLVRSIGSMAFGVSSTDPASYLIAVLVMFVAGLVGTIVPSWRASRVSAVEALS